MSEHEAIVSHYEAGYEDGRLSLGPGKLEMARTQELVHRFLPGAPAVVYDVGGGSGRYACWLARLGYEVHLLDVVPLHVEQALKHSAAQPETPLASVAVGDARHLDLRDESADAVLLFGPLYHLTERGDRLAALREAYRVLKPGGVVLAVGISRFASALDGLSRRLLDDPAFRAIVERDLLDGQHRNPANHPRYFTTAYFHYPDELRSELTEAGFTHAATLAIEGPVWMLQDFDEQWSDPERRERMLATIRAIESEPVLIGASAHLMAAGRKD